MLRDGTRTNASLQMGVVSRNEETARRFPAADAPYALVTGATSGIGLAIARQLTRYNLVLASRDEARMHNLAAELGPRTIILPTDLANEGSATELFRRCRHLPIDVVVCNAGIGRMGDHVDLSLTEVARTIRLNAGSVVELCALFGRAMRTRGQGYLMTVGSLTGFLPVPYFAEYAATKALVVSFSRALHQELRPHGVQVSCLCPRATVSEFAARANLPRYFAESLMMNAEDVARAGLRGLWRGDAIVTPGGLRDRALMLFGPMIPQTLLAWHIRRHLKD